MNIFRFLFLIFFTRDFAFSSEVSVVVHLWPTLGNFRSKTSEIKGEIRRNKDTLVVGDIRVPLSSLRSGIDMRDRHMFDYLETEKFPDAKLSKIILDQKTFRGVFEVHGVEKPVLGQYEIRGKEVFGKFKIKYQDFGIKKASYKGPGLPAVGVMNDVTVEVVLSIQEQ